MADIKQIQIGSNTYDIRDGRTSFPPEEHTHPYIPTSQKGAANGVAELDSSAKVPEAQLPDSVFNVKNYASQSAFPATGKTDMIYVANDTNKTYRWDGSAYVDLASTLTLGETSTTAYRGDRGKAAYDHSLDTSVHVTSAEKSTWNAKEDTSNKVTSWSATTSDTKYPSEKLVKDSLDGKAASVHTHTAAQVSGLATVATSGSYNDLSNKPTIPTVNNGQLTMQINGTQKATFTANQSTDTTFNVTAADLGLSQALVFKGITTTNLTDGATTSPITMKDSSSLTPTVGNVVLTDAAVATWPNTEFVWAESKWNKLGDAKSYVVKGTTSSSNGAHTHTVSGTAGSTGAHTHSVTATGSISVGTGTANYTPSGTVASHTHSITKSTTTVNTGYTHTPASLGGTTSFNTDAIKAVALNSATQTGTGYIQYVESATSPSLGGTTTFLASVKTAGSASLTGTTSFLTGIKTAGSASLTGTKTFNTDAVKATVNGTTLELTAASTGTVGISHSDPTFNSGTVGISHSDPTFNTGTVTLSGGAHTTKYLYPSTTAASKETVAISGGSISSTGTTTVVTDVSAATGATQPGFSGTPVELKFAGSAANTSSNGDHTHTVSGTAASDGAHTHTVG